MPCYPKVEVPKELGGGEATVIAWIWARTVKCPNPACGCEMPLVRSFTLSTKKGNSAWVKPFFDEAGTHFEVHRGGKPAIEGTVSRKGAVCACCGAPVDFNYIRDESKNGRMGSALMSVVAEGSGKRLYLQATEKQKNAANICEPEDAPDGFLPEKALGFRVQLYGMDQYKKLFTNRQLTALTTFSDLVAEAQAKAEEDALAAGMADDGVSIADGGSGAKAYGQAVGVYLAFLVDQMTNQSASICGWNNVNTQMRCVFSRQAIPMVWDYAECNVFSNSSGSYNNLLERMVKAFDALGSKKVGIAGQADAQSDCGLRDIMVSSDPPYYDNIGYADLSDFFYVWMRRSLKGTYPKLFRTMLVPKAEELIATPYRHDGSVDATRDFFEDGMLQTCRQIYKYARKDIPVTIYYAYRQSETDADGGQTTSTGWETMLNAIVWHFGRFSGYRQLPSSHRP